MPPPRRPGVPSGIAWTAPTLDPCPGWCPWRRPCAWVGASGTEAEMVRPVPSGNVSFSAGGGLFFRHQKSPDFHPFAPLFPRLERFGDGLLPVGGNAHPGRDRPVGGAARGALQTKRQPRSRMPRCPRCSAILCDSAFLSSLRSAWGRGFFAAPRRVLDAERPKRRPHADRGGEMETLI